MAKRIKHYYGNEVYHIFFHRPEGVYWAKNYTDGNRSWNKNILYSYSSELGWADFENKVIYLRGGTRSSNTSQHQGELCRAIPHDWKIVRIQDWWNWYRPYDKPPILVNDFKWYYTKLTENRNALHKGVKYFGNPGLVNEYLELITLYLTTANQLESLEKFKADVQSYYFTEAEVDMWNIKTWCQEKGITGSYATKIKVYHNPDLAKDIIEKNKIKKKKYAVDKENRLRKKNAKLIEDWYAGKGYYFPFYTPRVYLRLKNEQEVQTSKGVTVPLIKAHLLYRKLMQCINENKSWKTNGDKFTIGSYQVESIHFNEVVGEWEILAGCHRIYQTEINEFVTKFVPEWQQ
jgi:hypothetical protein